MHKRDTYDIKKRVSDIKNLSQACKQYYLFFNDRSIVLKLSRQLSENCLLASITNAALHFNNKGARNLILGYAQKNRQLTNLQDIATVCISRILQCQNQATSLKNSTGKTISKITINTQDNTEATLCMRMHKRATQIMDDTRIQYNPLLLAVNKTKPDHQLILHYPFNKFTQEDLCKAHNTYQTIVNNLQKGWQQQRTFTSPPGKTISAKDWNLYLKCTPEPEQPVELSMLHYVIKRLNIQENTMIQEFAPATPPHQFATGLFIKKDTSQELLNLLHLDAHEC